MLPQNVVSDTPVSSTFQWPDSIDVVPLESYELGGVAINDPSEGRQVQAWLCWVEGNAMKVSPYESGTPETTLFTFSGEVTMVSLAFDASMAPTVAYEEDGVIKLWWYDTLIEDYRTDSFPDATSAGVCSDDKRALQSAVSDVVFAYVADDYLYWRQQRDRYTVEYTAGQAGGGRLRRLGMNTVNRLQFELVQ